MNDRPNPHPGSGNPQQGGYPPPRPPQGEQGYQQQGQYQDAGYQQQQPYGQQNYQQVDWGPNGAPPEKTIMLICCVLGFVVAAGIHRFLSGHILLGIVYLLTWGFCFIGTIVDLVAITNGSYTDVHGRRLIDK